MSAEKEVVNFWLNRKGYFTVNNLKSKNKDIGILALKFDKTILEKIMHLEVNCSITGIADQNYISNTIIEKFDDKGITNTISDYSKNMKKDIKIEKIVVLNSMPKEKKDIIGKLEKKEIKLDEFEDILSDVMQGLNTGYFKDDVTRTLQLVKFLLVQNPKKFVDVLESV